VLRGIESGNVEDLRAAPCVGQSAFTRATRRLARLPVTCTSLYPTNRNDQKWRGPCAESRLFQSHGAKNMTNVLCGLIAISLAACCCFPDTNQGKKNQTPPPPAAPDTRPFLNEADFIKVVESFFSSYDAAPNELKKSALRADRRQAMEALFVDKQPLKVKDWEGTLANMITSPKGNAIVTIRLAGTKRITVANHTILLGEDISWTAPLLRLYLR
jgi:hypothetical protein